MSISEMRNTTTGKVVGFLAALALVMSMTFAGTYAPAQAQTQQELQDQIAQLLALIADLQAQISGSTTTSGQFSYVFTRDLTQGSTGEDVMKLQQYLNMNAATRVAAVGAAGGPGTETSYYGPATAAAVSKYQVANAASILTPLGLSSGTGYFGASTRAFMNVQIAAGTGTGSGTGTGTGTGTGSTTLKGGEAVIQNVTFDAEDDPSEAESGAKIATISYDIIGGDVQLNRADLVFAVNTTNGLTETRPWRVFNKITLLDSKGDKIGSIDASNRDLWSKETTPAGYDAMYSIRISGLDYVTRMDDEAEITVSADLNNSITGAGTASDKDIELSIPANGLRFVDAAGLVQYAPAGPTSSQVLSVLAEGAGDSLSARTNSSNPLTGSILVDDTDDSAEQTVLVATLRTGDNDVVLDGATVTVTTTGSNYDKVVKDAFLVVDGKEFSRPTVTNAGTKTATLVFDTKELILNSDDDYDAEVVLVFKGATGNYTAGTETVQAKLTAVSAEGRNSQDIISVSGLSKDGNVQTLRTATASISGVTSKGETLGTTTKPGYLRFQFTVTAEDGDLSLSLADIAKTISGPNTAVVSAGSLVKIGGTATDNTGPSFDILEGQTGIFSLEYVVTPAVAGDNGTYYATLDSVLGVQVNQTASVTVSS